MSVFGQEGFGVELHALDGIFLMAHAHNLAVFRPCRDFQTFGQRAAFDNEAVITRTGNRIGQPPKHTLARMGHGRHLTVHQRFGADYPAAERLAYRLMPEAHAHNRQPAGKMAHRRHGNPRFFGRTRTGPDNEILRIQCLDFLQRNIIVAAHGDFLPQFSEILDNVVSKTVVIVDKQKHFVINLLIYNLFIINCISDTHIHTPYILACPMRPRESGAEPRVLTSTPFCHLFDHSGKHRFYALINFGYPIAKYSGILVHIIHFPKIRVNTN